MLPLLTENCDIRFGTNISTDERLRLAFHLHPKSVPIELLQCSVVVEVSKLLRVWLLSGTSSQATPHYLRLNS